MAYRYTTRRIGDATSNYTNLGTAPTTLSGWFSDPLGALNKTINDLENLAYSAGTGNISASDVANIKAQGDAAIAQAAGGNQDLATQEQNQWHQELTTVVQQGNYTGWQNLLADWNSLLGTIGLGSSASNPSGVLGWIETNFLWVFAGVAAFLIFRPDKALLR